MNTSLNKLPIIFIALAAIVTSTLAAEEATLKVGDHAPKLQTGKYVQGDPVKEFQPGKAYIVEFWATWCGPCRTSIPHLNDVYNKYKDKGLVVIGQDCWEQDESLVEPFVKKMGDKMTYRVALDDKNGSEKGKMADTWMTAAGRHGIPTAFLVDKKGLIAWIGHPMELEQKQTIIDQVLAGKYDLQKAAADYNKQLGEQAALQQEMAPAQAKMNAMNKALRAKKWDEALADLTDAQKLLPENRRAAWNQRLDFRRFDILIGKKDYPAAYKFAEKMADEYKYDTDPLNYVAWEIVSNKTIEKPDLDLAEKLINRADKMAGGKDAQILDTKARVQFAKGQKAAAIETQTQALALADTSIKEQLQATLNSYKKGNLPDSD